MRKAILLLKQKSPCKCCTGSTRGKRCLVFSQPVSALDGNSAVTFVIPTEAYPDFLLPGTTNGRVCGFL